MPPETHLNSMETAARRAWRRYLLPGLGAVLLLGGLAWWWWQPVRVAVVRVEAQPLSRSLQFTARVESRERVDLGVTLTPAAAPSLGARLTRTLRQLTGRPDTARVTDLLETL